MVHLSIAERRWFLARFWTRVCSVAYLRGAQEEMWAKLLQLQFATDPRQVLGWMLSHGVTHLLTLNSADFTRYPGITTLVPADLATAP